jgi:hypothetical protein
MVLSYDMELGVKNKRRTRYSALVLMDHNMVLSYDYAK